MSDRGYLAQWLAESQADAVMTEQRLCIALRALRTIMDMTDQPDVRALAAAAIAQTRDEQDQLMAGKEPA